MPPSTEITKRPLLVGQFVWIASKKDGKLRMLVGSDALEATEDDIFMVKDPTDATKVVAVVQAMEAIQPFITLKPKDYAVISNPSEAFIADYPNGQYVAGRNDLKPLRYGTKRVVTSGHFPIWPGQKVEVRRRHDLTASQFLVVQVEGDVDVNAPYYDLTVRCAGIKKAVVDMTVASADGAENSLKTDDLTEGATTAPAEKGEGKPSKEMSAEKYAFQSGQRIIIPGNLTPTYIPPSGIEVKFRSSALQEDIESVDPKESLRVIKNKIAQGDLTTSNIRAILRQAGLEESIPEIDRVYKTYRDARESRESLMGAITDVFGRESFKLSQIAAVLSSPGDKEEVNTDPVVREAVVLGPTEFCVLIDEDGRPQTKQGPGRVFPGPNDSFRTQGSRDRVYDAYHLQNDRGLLLRIVADSVSKDELLKQLPHPPDSSCIGKDVFHKGDEIFIGGFDAYLVPSNTFEVINPETRLPHIGNDHAGVYVQAIGVDQKSGVYVASVETGNVALVKGETKLLLDPRKQKHVRRRIPARMWNLMIGQGEPHKRTDSAMVETPWAACVVVPNNEAVLVTSKGGHKPVIGPAMLLLEYEEWLEVMTLSRGRPKSDDRPLETCFLRVKGNRIGDQIDVETSDFVTLRVEVSYGVEFEGQTPEEQAAWFNYKDYVMLLCSNLRSRLRAAARQKTLNELYPTVADFVRDIVLGKKPGEDGQHRPGLFFTENNMRVTEVEVLAVAIPDENVARKLVEANRKIVTLSIEDKAMEAELQSADRRAGINAQRVKLAQEEILVNQNLTLTRIEADKNANIRTAEAKNAEATRSYELNLALKQRQEKDRQDQERSETEFNNAKAELIRLRRSADERLEQTLDDEERQKVLAFREKLAGIEKDMTAAGAAADVSRLNAFAPRLVAAIEGLGDKQALAALAEHLPEATGELGFLLGQGGLAGLKRLLDGSPFGGSLERLLSMRTGDIKDAGDNRLRKGTSDPELGTDEQ